jgi:hypothetical protein
MSATTEKKQKLYYLILQEFSGQELGKAVSALMERGWKLHGDLHVFSGLNHASPTFVAYCYAQALYHDTGDTFED